MSAKFILPILEFAGSPFQMGASFGEECRDEIHELYELRLKNSLSSCRLYGKSISETELLNLSAECLNKSIEYDEETHKELMGIAEGSELSAEKCFLMQGLTDMRDLAAFDGNNSDEGCSSFIIGPDLSKRNELVIGQNWDLQTDNMPFVKFINRKPAEGPETWSLTLSGCLSLIGINSDGIAVGTTNLKTFDVRPGVHYLNVLHSALNSRTLPEAEKKVKNAERAGGHYFFIGNSRNEAVGLECSAKYFSEFRLKKGFYVHCNHALSDEIIKLEAEQNMISTHYRQKRLEQLISGIPEKISLADIKEFLSDHEGGEDRCLCRHNYNGLSTNASVVIFPCSGEIHACKGQPHSGKWLRKSFRSLN